MLALGSGRPIPTEALIAGLWGEGEPRTAPKVLQTYVSHLRRTLPPDCVVSTSLGYMLQLEPEALDARCFELAVAEAAPDTRGRQPPQCSTNAPRGISALERPSLPRAGRAFMGHRRGGPLGRTAPGREGRPRRCPSCDGRPFPVGRRAPGSSRRRAAAGTALGQLILALYRAGRQADALRAFARLRSTLADELGVEPSPELVALEQ